MEGGRELRGWGGGGGESAAIDEKRVGEGEKSRRTGERKGESGKGKVQVHISGEFIT